MYIGSLNQAQRALKYPHIKSGFPATFNLLALQNAETEVVQGGTRPQMAPVSLEQYQNDKFQLL
jgi:hypothetical protein